MNYFDPTKVMKRVVRGYNWLDKNYPDWQVHIDEDILDLEDGVSCIMGQVFGEFTKGVRAALSYKDLGITPSEAADRLPAWNNLDDNEQEWAARHGFLVFDKEMDSSESSRAYSLLTECWLFLINRDASWGIKGA